MKMTWNQAAALQLHNDWEQSLVGLYGVRTR